MLELLVGVVDAELLKAVGLEVLESKDVEDADRQTLRRVEAKCIPCHHEPYARQIKRLPCSLAFLCENVCVFDSTLGEKMELIQQTFTWKIKFKILQRDVTLRYR